MALAVTFIQTITVGSGGSATIDFTSIPQTYTDLMVLFSTRSTDLQGLNIKFNNTSTTYTTIHMSGDGSSSTTNNNYVAGWTVYSGATSNVFGNNMYYIPNYTGSNQKVYSVESVSENNSATTGITMMMTGAKWNGTSAINQITFNILSSGNFAQYSKASLYGIKNS